MRRMVAGWGLLHEELWSLFTHTCSSKSTLQYTFNLRNLNYLLQASNAWMTSHVGWLQQDLGKSWQVLSPKNPNVWRSLMNTMSLNACFVVPKFSNIVWLVCFLPFSHASLVLSMAILDYFFKLVNAQDLSDLRFGWNLVKFDHKTLKITTLHLRK